MVEGFWVLQVEAVQGKGGGVVFFSKGQVFGGDTGFYYTGKYETDKEALRAHILVRRFLPDVGSLIGIEGDYELDVTGTLKGDVINGKASLAGKPGPGLVIRLTKRADLP